MSERASPGINPVGHWYEENRTMFPALKDGRCNECDVDTWIAVYDSGHAECYFHGCTDVDYMEIINE